MEYYSRMVNIDADLFANRLICDICFCIVSSVSEFFPKKRKNMLH